jgi:hypothetical protein
LGSVVQVSFQTTPGLIAGVDDTNARSPHLSELGSKIGVEAFVLQGEAGGTSHRLYS